MEITEGSTAHTLAILAMDRAEALDKTTVELQAIVLKQLAEAQTILRQEAGAMQAILRQETAALETLRQGVQREVAELKALQPGIERSAGRGVHAALTKGMSEIRRDLAGQISDSAGELKDAAGQVQGMVRRLTPLWASLIATGGLLLGMLLMYFFTLAGQMRIEEKIDRLQQAAPVAVQPAAVDPPATAGSKSVHSKPQGKRTAAPKSKAQQAESGPPADSQP